MKSPLCVLMALSLGAAAPPVEQHRVAGLNAPVELRLDRWGVPHIYAKSREDAFFAQGFNAARDRLWQIDLWRKRGWVCYPGTWGPNAWSRIAPRGCSSTAATWMRNGRPMAPRRTPS